MPTKNTRKVKKDFAPGSVHHTFSARNITNYGGLKPVINFAHKQGISKFIDRFFPTHWWPSTKFSTTELLYLFILGSMAGLNRLRNIERFSTDPLVGRLLGLVSPVDEDTFKYRLRQLGDYAHYHMQTMMHSINQQLAGLAELTKVTLDMDSSTMACYGKQEGAEKGYNTEKRGANGYHPLVCFVAETKMLLNSWFRCGSAHTGNGAAAFIRETLSILPAKVRNVWVRADSGYFDDALLSALEEHDCKYVVKVRLKGLKALLARQRWYTIGKDKQTCRFQYQCAGWQQPRWFYGVRIVTDWQYNKLFDEWEPIYSYFCYCSNLQSYTPWAIHRFYGKRAESENWIDQLKNHVQAGRTRTDSFAVNDMLWQLACLAYNLSTMMRYVTDGWSWRQEHRTFREWFIAVAGKVVTKSRRWFLHMSRHTLEQERWQLIAGQLC